jgi:hypothetical protein
MPNVGLAQALADRFGAIAVVRTPQYERKCKLLFVCILRLFCKN